MGKMQKNDRRAIVITSVASGIMLLLIAAFFVISYLGSLKRRQEPAPMAAVIKAVELAAFGSSSVVVPEANYTLRSVKTERLFQCNVSSVPADDLISIGCGEGPYRIILADVVLSFEESTLSHTVLLAAGSEGVLCYWQDESEELLFSPRWQLSGDALLPSGNDYHHVSVAISGSGESAEFVSRYYEPDDGSLRFEHCFDAVEGSCVLSVPGRLFVGEELF